MSVSTKAKFKSLSLTNEPVVMSITEIVDMLKEAVRNQERILDAGTVAALADADDDLLDTLLAEYDSQLLWNLTNTELGKGILIGFLISSVTNYYDDLRRAEADDEDENMTEDTANKKKREKESLS